MATLEKTQEKTETTTSTPVARSPSGSALDALRWEFDRLFDDFRSSVWRRPASRIPGLDRLWPREDTFNVVPAISVVEKDNAYDVVAELPGIDEKNLEIKLSGGVLSICGEKCEQREDEQKNYHYSERRFGSFMRSLPVPEGVDTTKIDATFDNGLLTITMPKTPEAQKNEKIIPVKHA
ncbi:Hsp20/alpha crystallin family protein [Gluconacetobacter tumulicola]|uniref:Hsp20/alpha crystallin family protein n=1 Tax=Gluconacetobacter tumulicola TaxID=1017177 RepID=A0A7W4P748_9PROT|nr:Hsp20/alpha crystallin family protein [Gluconacetobacter tumulicola]MBB2179594.1 Hsp20/alpha crystallin family protein [Gluconacetobacter tumulicola]